jgi:hypothetical protein
LIIKYWRWETNKRVLDRKSVTGVMQYVNVGEGRAGEDLVIVDTGVDRQRSTGQEWQRDCV